jgi:hypothetical protein
MDAWELAVAAITVPPLREPEERVFSSRDQSQRTGCRDPRLHRGLTIRPQSAGLVPRGALPPGSPTRFGARAALVVEDLDGLPTAVGGYRIELIDEASPTRRPRCTLRTRH